MGKMYTVAHFERDDLEVSPFVKVERTMEEARRAADEHHKEMLEEHEEPTTTKLRMINEEPDRRTYESEYDGDWEWYIQQVEAVKPGSTVYTVTFLDRADREVTPFKEVYDDPDLARQAIVKHIKDLSDGECDTENELSTRVYSDTMTRYDVMDYAEDWRWYVGKAEYK